MLGVVDDSSRCLFEAGLIAVSPTSPDMEYVAGKTHFE
jgi:hypothetical protein